MKINPSKRADLDNFAACYKPANRHERKPTWSEKNPEGRWRSFDYDALVKRDKLNLDILWLKDKSLEDSENPPEPDMLAQEIIDDLENALEQLRSVAAELKASA
jgi:type I restriction enzyme M protein